MGGWDDGIMAGVWEGMSASGLEAEYDLGRHACLKVESRNDNSTGQLSV